MRYLTLGEIVALHDRVIRAWGGSAGIRDLAALESATAQPRMTFGGEDLYPDLPTKAAALAFSLIKTRLSMATSRLVMQPSRRSSS